MLTVRSVSRISPNSLAGHKDHMTEKLRAQVPSFISDGENEMAEDIGGSDGVL
jgi:hypothetical protein